MADNTNRFDSIVVRLDTQGYVWSKTELLVVCEHISINASIAEEYEYSEFKNELLVRCDACDQIYYYDVLVN